MVLLRLHLVAEMGFVCPICFCVKLSSGLSAIRRSDTTNNAVCRRCDGGHRPRQRTAHTLVRSVIERSSWGSKPHRSSASKKKNTPRGCVFFFGCTRGRLKEPCVFYVLLLHKFMKIQDYFSTDLNYQCFQCNFWGLADSFSPALCTIL